MTWSGFRPSDDPSEFGFPVAANMYAAAGLERALELNRQVRRWLVQRQRLVQLRVQLPQPREAWPAQPAPDLRHGQCWAAAHHIPCMCRCVNPTAPANLSICCRPAMRSDMAQRRVRCQGIAAAARDTDRCRCSLRQGGGVAAVAGAPLACCAAHGRSSAEPCCRARAPSCRAGGVGRQNVSTSCCLCQRPR